MGPLYEETDDVRLFEGELAIIGLADYDGGAFLGLLAVTGSSRSTLIQTPVRRGDKDQDNGGRKWRELARKKRP